MYGYTIHGKNIEYNVINDEIVEFDEHTMEFDNFADFYIALKSEDFTKNKCLLLMYYNNEKECPIDEYLCTNYFMDVFDSIEEKHKEYKNISVQGFKSELESLEYLVSYLGDMGISY